MQAEPGLPGEITAFLHKYNRGDKEALASLISLVYKELRREAARHLAAQNRQLQTLPPTGLVHEVYIRLRDQDRLTFENRRQFFWFAGRLMRQVMADCSRNNLARKRGGEAALVPLDEAAEILERQDLDPAMLVALDEALTRLWRVNPRQCQIVEMRFFAGLEVAETAKILGLSPTTIKREWHVAKLWLGREMFGKGKGGRRSGAVRAPKARAAEA